MKKQINLIPLEMTVPSKSVHLAKTINKISTFSAVILIFLILVSIGAFVYYNVQGQKTTASINSLKQKIVELEKSEQKLILAKDKISKISYIKSLDSVDDELVNFKDFEQSINSASSSAFTEVSIDADKTETSLIFPNSESLTVALQNVSNLKQYKKVILTSLGFNSNSGYLLNLIFQN
jgi:hypothetical protein